MDKTINIFKTETQEVYFSLPSDMINTEWRDLNDVQAIDMIFSRMKWVNDESELRLRIVTQTNLDCVFEICSTDMEDKDQSQRFMKLLSACRIDNMHTDNFRANSPHYFLDPFSVTTRLVTERLIRKN